MDINVPNEIIEELILIKIKLFTKENYFNSFSNILIKLSSDIFAFTKKDSLSLSLSAKLKEKNFSSKWNIIFLLIFPSKRDNIQMILDLNPLCFQYLLHVCHIKVRELTKLSNEIQIPIEKLVSLYLGLCEKRIKMNTEEKQKQKQKTKLIESYRQINEIPLKFPKLFLLGKNEKAKLKPKKIISSYSSNTKQLDYNNSYTRLFIGETDEQSIRERYLSNMVVKKQKELHLLNSIEEFSLVYLKKMYKKLFKNKERNSMDNDMVKIMKQFEDDHKKLDNLKRNVINSDKPHYMLDYNQGVFPFQSNESKITKRNIKHKRKINKFNSSLYPSLEVSKYNNPELGFTSRFRFKNFNNNSLNSETQKFRDFVFSRRTIIDTYKKNNNNLNQINTIRLKRNFSLISKRPIVKLNKSILFNDKKYSSLKNYMNRSDFFFNKS